MFISDMKNILFPRYTKTSFHPSLILSSPKSKLRFSWRKKKKEKKWKIQTILDPFSHRLSSLKLAPTATIPSNSFLDKLSLIIGRLVNSLDRRIRSRILDKLPWITGIEFINNVRSLVVCLSGWWHGVLLQNGAELRHDSMVSCRGMVGVGTLVGRDLGRFRFVERDASLRVQSRSLPVSESHLPIHVFGPGHPAGASSLRDRGETTSKMLLCKEPKEADRTWEVSFPVQWIKK